MKQFQKDFVDFLYETGALKFGDFTLKSGRKSPFFVNLGDFNTSESISRLAHFYASAIYETYGDGFDVLFGPAYKGIPLAVSTAIMLQFEYKMGKVRYCSNRKEIKDHGDAGILLGYKLKEGDRVVIIEDVITSGKSMEETVPILREQANVDIIGLEVSLNRCERGKGDKGALDEIKDLYGFETNAIVSMKDVVEYLYGREVNGRVLIDDEMKARIDEYYSIYGIKED